MAVRSRRSRWVGLVGLALARLRTQATRSARGRIAATVAVVAVTIAVLLIVTGVALSLADESAASADADADVRIAPEAGSTLSSVAGAEGARLGEGHERTEAIASRPGVAHATPVLVEVIRVEDPGRDRSAYVLAVGVVPDGEGRTIAGLSTEALGAGDPHYADGSYDGPRSGEVVLSEGAADRLDVAATDSIVVESPRTGAGRDDVTIAAIEAPASVGLEAGAPIVLVPLAELQSLTGAAGDDLADHVLVWGEAGPAKAAGQEAYPDAVVESGAGPEPDRLFDDGLALATALVAAIVGLAVCSLFVATTTGLAVDADRRSLAVLAAIGVSTRSRLAIVACSTLAITVCGGLAGVALGAAGIAIVNRIAALTVVPGAVAAFHPALVPYGLTVALLSAVLALPYPLAIAARTPVLAEVGR